MGQPFQHTEIKSKHYNYTIDYFELRAQPGRDGVALPGSEIWLRDEDLGLISTLYLGDAVVVGGTSLISDELLRIVGPARVNELRIGNSSITETAGGITFNDSVYGSVTISDLASLFWTRDEATDSVYLTNVGDNVLLGQSAGESLRRLQMTSEASDGSSYFVYGKNSTGQHTFSVNDQGIYYGTKMFFASMNASIHGTIDQDLVFTADNVIVGTWRNSGLFSSHWALRNANPAFTNGISSSTGMGFPTATSVAIYLEGNPLYDFSEGNFTFSQQKWIKSGIDLLRVNAQGEIELNLFTFIPSEHKFLFDENTYVYKDVLGNMTFYDDRIGAEITLSELASMSTVFWGRDDITATITPLNTGDSLTLPYLSGTGVRSLFVNPSGKLIAQNLVTHWSRDILGTFNIVKLFTPADHVIIGKNDYITQPAGKFEVWANNTELIASFSLSDILLTLPAKSTETNVIYYDTVTGKLTYGVIGASSNWQRNGTTLSPLIAGDTIFSEGYYVGPNYEGLLSYTTNTQFKVLASNGTALVNRGKDLVLSAGQPWNVSGADAGDVFIIAGHALNADGGSIGGSVYISPGNPYSTTQNASVFLGNSSYTANGIILRTEGSQTHVNLTIQSKGIGSVLTVGGAGSNALLLRGQYIDMDGMQWYYSSRLLGFSQDSTIKASNGSIGTIHGKSLTITAGTGWDNGNGGNLYFIRGYKDGTGTDGNYYFGTGSVGHLPAKTSETNAVYYDAATGKLSYGVISSGAPTYSNAVAMPTAVGGFEAGTTFVDKTLDEMWTGLLYPYMYPTFSSFIIQNQPATPIECGIAMVSADKPFYWATTNSSNVKANTINIYDVTNSVYVATGLANDGVENVQCGTIIKTVNGATQVYRIEGQNTKDQAMTTRSVTHVWYSPIYHGVGAAGLSVAQLQQLSGKRITGEVSFNAQFTTSNQKIYICYPAAWGDLASIKDQNLFDVTSGFTKSVQSFTLQAPYYNGSTMNYNVYESNTLSSVTNYTMYFNF